MLTEIRLCFDFFCEEVRWLLCDNSIKYDGSEVEKMLVHYPFFQSFTLIISYAITLPLVRNAFSIVLLKINYFWLVVSMLIVWRRNTNIS